MNKIISLILTCALVSCFSLSVFAASTSSKPQIFSQSVILMDNTDKPLFQKNATERRAPASTTKLMTALLVVENGELDDIVTIEAKDLQLPDDYATGYLYAGEKFTVEELLHALLMQSANAAGNILARYVDGSPKKFAKHMTSRAKELGCTNTNFVNTYGQTNSRHYSTAQDLCIIAKAALRYPILRKIIHTKYYRLPATNVYKANDRVLGNTNVMLYKDSFYYDSRVRGGKTGYTHAAGRCLVTLAEENHYKLYAVVLGGGPSNGQNYHFSDTKKLLDYGFAVHKAH